MAEEGSVYELEGLEKQLQSLLSRRSSDELRADSKRFCTEYCKLVEQHASRWQLPLPQLRVLEMALCYFARASSSFTSNCDSVLNTLSSLALSVFELLLFFDEKDFHQEPLKQFTVTFQECHLALARHQNVHLLQVERLVQAGGAWASSALQAILSESSLPQNEVDGCLNSELPVFFELRVRYLFSCKRVSEAIALAKCCARHPTAGQHLFFLQVYLSWLYKTSQHDYLRNEVADISGKDAVYIICSLECEETDEILLALSRAFLSQQLSRGDMYHLCDLVFIWSKLHSRLNTSKQALLEESHQLMRFATNVNSIFPFIRVVLQELGEDGIQFCVELCANALESCLSCDVLTKSLIYKTIAGLLPNDLEVCRACALLVFFLERSVDAYKMVYLLYMHPDQEYHVEHSPIRNHIRFETLQVLKKDLYFDPEFWNLIALRTNCLKLMSEKVVGAALEELMEEKWISSYCAKEIASESGTTRGQKGRKGAAGKRRHQRVDGTDMAPKRLRQGKLRKDTREASSDSMRRSFWQLDRIQDNGSFGYGQQRRTTRLSEKNPPKRRIRTPKWLLEDSGTLEKSVPSKIKRHGLKHQKEHQSSVVRRSDSVKFKNSSKHKSSVNSQLKTRENNTKGCSLDSPRPACPPQVILELSLPDNELMGTFTEDTCNRHRGYPQMLLYKQTVKLPAMPQTSKAVHGKEVILRARDANMFVQLLHCYGRRQKGKGNLLNIHASVSTITRSSARGSPPKDSQRELPEKLCDEMKDGIPSQPLVPTELTAKVPETPNTEMASQKVPTTELFKKSPEIKVTVPSQTSVAVKMTENTVLDKVPQAQAGEKISETQQTSPMELCEEPAVEMKVTIASQTPAIDKVNKSQTVEEVSKTATSPEASNTLMTQKGVTVSSMPNNYDHVPSQSQEVFEDEEPNLKSLQKCNIKNTYSDPLPGETHAADYDVSQLEITRGPMKSDLSLVTEVVTEFTSLEHSRDQEKDLAAQDIAFKESVPLLDSKPNAHHKISSLSVAEQDTSADADVQDVKEEGTKLDGYSDDGEPMDSAVESEESRLEFCCTFCNKDFKGSRVVGHAMFHFRKDECMFCGTVFKDDLLAMMHLSDHIEKLKRAAGSCKAQENRLSETKDTSTTKTSAQAKTISMSPGHRSSKRLRKSSVSLKALSQVSESRKLRSNDKSAECQFSQKNKQNKVAERKSTIHNLNGHIGKKKPFDKMEKDPSNAQVKQNKLTQNKAFDAVESPTFPETCPILGNSSSPVPTNLSSFKEDKVKERESMHILKNATKQNGKGDDRNVEPQEKLSCPAEGCTWFTDMSKNRVALLYHALDEHHGDIKPLELSFHVGNSRCSICMRVLWSFEHFQHHVERHQVTPRHPCPHQGCTARFKTAMEMRRHARKHSPLQAVCCQPGCSQLFICLWALNLHEREHYAAKHTKPAKGTHVQKSNDKHGTQVERKQFRKPKDSASMVKKTGRKVRGQNFQNSVRNDIVANPSTLKLTVVKKEHRVRHESKVSHVLKNLSNKDATTQLATPNLRLRHTPRKGQVPKSNLMVSKKVFSSTLLKRNTNTGEKLTQKQDLVDIQCRKRRGRPPKVKRAVHDENAAAQKNETVKNQTDKTHPTSTAETGETPTVSNIFQAEEKESLHAQHVEVTSKDESKKSTNEEKRNHFKQNEVSHHSTAEEKDINKQTSPPSENKTRKLTADTLKKLRNLMKRCAPNNQNAALGPSAAKKPRITSNKVNEKKSHHKQLDISNGSKQPEISKSTVPQVDEVVAERLTREECIAKSEHVDLPQVPDDCKPAVTAKNPILDKEHKKKCTKSHVTKKGRPPKERHNRTASTHSVRANKHKCDKKVGLVKRPLKDPRKVLLSKKTAKAKSEIKVVEVTAQNCHSTEEKSRDSTPDGPSSVVPAVTTLAKKKRLNKSLANQNSNKAKKDDKEQIVKKKGSPNNEGIQVASTTEPKVSQVTEVKAQEVESSVDKQVTVSEQPPKFSKSGYTLIVHGKSANEDEKSTVSIDALAEYGKKPYLRPPPSVYLDEKYTTMPKRRKEVSVFQMLQKSVPPEQAHVGTAAQRQRCANCFATFDNAVELQSHLQLQSCSNLFGFDSDEDGTS